MKSANGALILVLGILSIVSLGCLTGIPAWLMGNDSLRRIDQGLANPDERGLVAAGRILGIIATILSLIVPCAVLALVTTGLMAAPFMGR